MSVSTQDPAAPVEPAEPAAQSRLDRFFEITRRGSTVRREVLAGLTTFATMAYIVVLNPLIIGTAPDADGKTLGIPAVAGVTALVAAVMTIMMGIVGRVPFAVATGLGLNAFVAYAVASQMSWAEAMGLVVIEGLIITVLVLTGFRKAVFRAIPAELKAAIAAGIGLFIALIGFVDGGLVRAGTGVPLQLGSGSNGTLHGWPTVVFVVGLLVTGILVARKVKAGVLIGIVATTVVAVIVNALAKPGAALVDGKPNPDGWRLNVPTLPDPLVQTPDLHLLGNVSFGAFAHVGLMTALLLVFTLVLADFFDVMGTTVGLAKQANLATEDGTDMPRLGKVLFVDGVAAVAGGAGSASSATTYVESSSGIADGGRTGLTSVVTGVLFLGALLLTPLVSLVPSEAAGPALVVVGALMIRQVKDIDFTDVGVAVPAFLTMTLMPFTYSITNGIGAGFVSWVAIRVAQGKARQIHPLMWAVAAAFVVYFAINLVKAVTGVS
ncbi:NCS2 family permease [Micromonospora chaiyaphumensis]|uniref:Putative MFS transporter, AGZA family, xanthine/uracil permease n=1 Tax=Micromonospora chaiyaphumensis TaxID=307119 RepID=A0A1C4Z255_9ACTN|nr:NCS2 family permease [Micromonospora chaiyaphumensis]SCF27109.1 putative MFS transporter, AGZA family, xanthine/uracil permease [Micromonospora chaiyaphumensis]